MVTEPTTFSCHDCLLHHSLLFLVMIRRSTI
jgi:MinD superfamily P-loop ATPase